MINAINGLTKKSDNSTNIPDENNQINGNEATDLNNSLNNNGTVDEKSNPVRTGDSENILLYGSMLVLALSISLIGLKKSDKN